MRTTRLSVHAQILRDWQPAWCVTCLLPSALTCQVAVWVDRGETNVLDVTCCPECGEGMTP